MADLHRFFEARREGKSVGIAFSAFDLLHAGHAAFLLEAKSKCGFLIIGLHSDPSAERPETKNSPTETIIERWFKLQPYVDLTVPYNTEADLLLVLRLFKPDIRFLGDDYNKDKPITGDDPSIKLEFVCRDHGLSSSGLRKRICEE